MADYLEEYARRFKLPVRFGTRVDALDRKNDRFAISAGGNQFEADQVVIATGPYQAGRVPVWAAHLDKAIVQIHSEEYKNTLQLLAGAVLVVGAGNTGAELALAAAAAGHRVFLSGRDVGQVPFFFHYANGRLFWFLATRVITAGTAIGRRIRESVRAGHGGPLVRIRRNEIAAAGIERVARVVGSKDGKPLLEDGRVLDVASILWCSGFRMNFSWVHLPIFASDGYPLHQEGRVPSVPGLYFIGLPFQRSLSSSTLVGVGRDAALVAGWIVESLKRLGSSVEKHRHEHHDSRRLFRYAQDPSLLQETGRASGRRGLIMSRTPTRSPSA
jgi:putative flavoprotein involved in K+ transport